MDTSNRELEAKQSQKKKNKARDERRNATDQLRALGEWWEKERQT